MLRRSPGACGPTTSGPSEIIWTPGSLSPITAHSSPPCTTSRRGSTPNRRSNVSLAVASSAESRSGCHGGYERLISTSAPASRAAASIDATTSSRVTAFALLVIDASVRTASSVLTTLRLVLVSTVAGSAGLIATTPLGIVASRSSARALVVSSAASSRSAGSIESRSPSSVPAYSSRIAVSADSALSRNSSSARTATSARASRGSAFWLTPPSIRARRSGVCRSTRPRALFALTRPFAMSPPE